MISFLSANNVNNKVPIILKLEVTDCLTDYRNILWIIRNIDVTWQYNALAKCRYSLSCLSVYHCNTNQCNNFACAAKTKILHNISTHQYADVMPMLSLV